MDELCCLRRDPAAASWELQVITEREERASAAVAADAPFSEWGQTSAAPRLAAAVAGRLASTPAASAPAPAPTGCAPPATPRRKDPAVAIPPDTPRGIGPPDAFSDVFHELARPCPPYTDEESAAVFDDAVAALGIVRGLAWLGGPAAELRLLACLAAQAGQALPTPSPHAVSRACVGTTALRQGHQPDVARRLAPAGAAARRQALLLG